MTVHPTIENMGCNLCLVIMQSRSEKPVLSSNIMSLFPNSGHENKHYLQFSTTISSTESTSYLFVDFFLCVCGVFLCFFLFSHTSRAFDTSVTGLNSCFLQHFHRVFFADFFRVQLCVVVSMTCSTIALFFDRGKRIEHCPQGRTRLLNPVILHLFSIIITIKTQMKNTIYIKRKALVHFYQKQFLFKHSQENQKITLRSAA